jgi:hypothetical protein
MSRGDYSGSASNKSAKAAEPVQPKRKKRKLEFEVKEDFAVVAEYLFIEGFADTIENAEVMAENISETWANDIIEARAEEKRGLGSTGVQRQRQKSGEEGPTGRRPATSYSGGQNPQLRGKQGKSKEERRSASRRYVDQPGGIYAKPENKQGQGRYVAMQTRKRPDLGSKFD